jgi:hypothetical protein
MDDKRPALDTLTAEDFEARVSQPFRLQRPGAPALDLVLRAVHTHTYAPPTTRRRGFSIVLKSAVSGHLPQAIYTLTHDEMGTMDLFLVPIGVQEGGMCYEAVFN